MCVCVCSCFYISLYVCIFLRLYVFIFTHKQPQIYSYHWYLYGFPSRKTPTLQHSACSNYNHVTVAAEKCQTLFPVVLCETWDYSLCVKRWMDSCCLHGVDKRQCHEPGVIDPRGKSLLFQVTLSDAGRLERSRCGDLLGTLFAIVPFNRHRS